MDKEVFSEFSETEKAIKNLQKKTDLSKRKFILEIQSGYGDKIKNDISVKPEPKGFVNYIKKILKMF